jgi:hypothetical protein
VSEPDAVTPILPIDDHAEQGVHLLPAQLRKPGVEGLVRALGGPVQALEDAAYPLVAQGIDDATGHALTGIGELVGLVRAGPLAIDDTRYRVALKAWVRAMRSDGTAADIEAVIAILAGSAETSAWTLTETFPAGVLVVPAGPLLTDDGYVEAIIRRARAGGVDLQVIVPPAGDTFAFGTDPEEPEFDADRGWSDADQLAGGRLVGVVH